MRFRDCVRGCSFRFLDFIGFEMVGVNRRVGWIRSLSSTRRDYFPSYRRCIQASREEAIGSKVVDDCFVACFGLLFVSVVYCSCICCLD